VQRKLDADDRRRFIIELTDAGRDLVRQHAHDHYLMMSSYFDALTPGEQETLIELLEKLAADPRLNPQGA
jgi:DNA-binding MarR family transcriptional regulator